MLAQPALKSLVAKLLPKSERSALAALTTEAPVREVDGLWVVNLCRPHNCPADMATLVIDGQQARLWIGLFSREDGRVATRWYGNTEDYAALPERIRADFLARHGN
ncbi:MAG: hypothetical protein CFE45_01125 [Burkholderiales bacterium PBB5]|nr:MAG: hypothetical protein CFE45_01125 [Burkholderiales bacterium PBB5]